MIESSNLRIVDWYNMVELSNRRLVEWYSGRIVEVGVAMFDLWNGWRVESLKAAMVVEANVAVATVLAVIHRFIGCRSGNGSGSSGSGNGYIVEWLKGWIVESGSGIVETAVVVTKLKSAYNKIMNQNIFQVHSFLQRHQYAARNRSPRLPPFSILMNSYRISFREQLSTSCNDVVKHVLTVL